MSEQGDGPPPDRRSFDKSTVDRWQVFGGMAGVAALVLSVLGGVRDLVPLSLVAAGVVTLVGIGLLHRWSRRPPRTAKGAVLPVAVTVVGLVTAAVLGLLELRPADRPAPTGDGQTGDGQTGDGQTAAEFRTGTVRLNAGSSIDFDTTAEGDGVSAFPTPRTDLTFDRSVQAGHLVVLDGPRSYRSCATSADPATTVAFEQVEHGSALCVKTSEGRWAGLVVVMVDGAVFEFDLVVWETRPV
ncbi:hypothetical protein F4560_004179 [Saccharothrix ecbatanensis]|uniref:Uncharacterized protein n=1 Tax=Saccharothrix ecbatanensis TaxID=1105145 RepID=A0A7W9HLW6_9PSEU|nr:hypothetical protein [Saccharothrix ecbatanensis]MBB5804411.1 hypothetical protein [Saccharothrix ecbatanensis]